ncbi:MAG: ATP:cob(I)alamin adenosyltransferase [Candidatus Shapirobacteria bacterium]|jgi:cob(I)alamin adenosyltransferase
MITTKAGDGGKTLVKGVMMDKDSALIEALGEIDELQAVLLIVDLRDIAEDLVKIMGELGCGVRFSECALRTTFMEEEIKKGENELDAQKKFLLFKKEEAIYLNWVRTVARRIERRMAGLSKMSEVRGDLLKYFNRLSDYLFILARQQEDQLGG